MDEEEKRKRILEEQYFTAENMTYEEKHFYLNILKLCKDIINSENKVAGVEKCDFIQIDLKKNTDGSIHANGSVSISYENRFIDARIYFSDARIMVIMDVERIAYQGNHKKYQIIDEFRIEDNKLKRKSRYNYNMKEIEEIVENEEMKGRLR